MDVEFPIGTEVAKLRTGQLSVTGAAIGGY
jgi:hypothetical protein